MNAEVLVPLKIHRTSSPRVNFERIAGEERNKGERRKKKKMTVKVGAKEDSR